MAGFPQPSYGQGFARSAGESAYPGLWKGLIGAWVPALGPTGTTLLDWGPFKQHGTFVNTPNWEIPPSPSTGRHWTSGYSLFFTDTDDDEINIGVLAINTVQSHTMSVWAYTGGSNNSTTPLFHFESGSDDTFMAIKDEGSSLRGVNIRTGGSGTTINCSGDVIQPVGWHHWAYSWEFPADVLLAYQDGILIHTESAYGAGGGMPQDFTAGIMGSNTANDFDGWIGIYLMYNRVLPVAEIRQLYFNQLAPFILRRRVTGFVAAAALTTEYVGPIWQQQDSGGFVGRVVI